MPLSTTPTVVRRYVAFELRRLREAAGRSQADAAKRLDTASTRITHFESGRNLPKLPDVEILLPYYGAPELVSHLQDLISSVRTAGPIVELDLADMKLPTGFDMYVSLEQGASRVITYDALVVMGILQCRRYAAATVRGHLGDDLPGDQLDAVVDLRMRRQAALDRADPRLEVVSIVDEGVLRKEIGGRDVATEQLAYLLALGDRDNVTIRVLPYSAGAHQGFHGGFIRLEFPIPRDPGVVYLEDLSGGRYYDDTDVIDRYVEVGDRLMELALPPRESLSLIDAVRRELAA
ncbi:helix-turn-helix domain-containing protein [Actinosynnema sp. CS-041913]|uniref:helix-turn-helix domain-containing protein n=1 Tax=Actinosynnema sp. CS-041913 TaxID=3239917 RepID=UPI003D91B6FF